MKIIKWVLAIILVIPVTAFSFYKPIRALLPETYGLSCIQNICVDDLAKYDTAKALFESAKQYLEKGQGLSMRDPKLLFCSTTECQETFGLGNRAAFTLGTFGVTIAPRGWKEYYIAHELIHCWQAENFGSLFLIKADPWLIEGMAYALSNDPREKLHEPFESYRQEFIAWHRQNLTVPLIVSVGKYLESHI